MLLLLLITCAALLVHADPPLQPKPSPGKPPFTVKRTPDGEVDLLDLASKYNAVGDPLSALSVLAVVLNRSRSVPNDLMRSTALQRAVEITVEALSRPSLVINSDQVRLVFHVLGEVLLFSDSQLLKRRALDAMNRITEKAMAMKASPDLATINSTINTVLASYRLPIIDYERLRATNGSLERESDAISSDRSQIDLEIFASVRTTVRLLLSAAAAQVPLGSRTEFGPPVWTADSKVVDIFEAPEAYTAMIHETELQDIDIDTPYDLTRTVEASIIFGQELRQRFRDPWNCEGPGKEPCSSVVYSVTLWPRSGPYPPKKTGQQITPIVEINIYSPRNGEVQSVKGYLQAVQMSLTVTGDDPADGQEGDKYRVRCFFWSERKQGWKTDGVHLAESQPKDGKATCWSGHLTAFTVIRTRDSIENGTVVGIIVTAFMAVLLTGLLLTYVLHRHGEARANRLSAQKLVEQ